LVRIILLYESSCINCGVKAKYGCSSCEKPLCGRCISREKKDLLDNIIIPAGLCKECLKTRTRNYETGNFNPLSEAITIYVTDPSHKKRIEIPRQN
jgi:hypothetical protein